MYLIIKREREREREFIASSFIYARDETKQQNENFKKERKINTPYRGKIETETEKKLEEDCFVMVVLFILLRKSIIKMK